MPPKTPMSISSLPCDPLTALMTGFGVHFKTFDDSLTNAKTTLEAQRGGDKHFF